MLGVSEKFLRASLGLQWSDGEGDCKYKITFAPSYTPKEATYNVRKELEPTLLRHLSHVIPIDVVDAYQEPKSGE